MANSVYLIVFTGDRQEATEAVSGIQDKYAKAHVYQPNIVLVETNDLRSDIKHKAGLSEDGGNRGAVFKISEEYGGYTSKSLWQWLSSTAVGR